MAPALGEALQTLTINSRFPECPEMHRQRWCTTKLVRGQSQGSLPRKGDISAEV